MYICINITCILDLLILQASRFRFGKEDSIKTQMKNSKRPGLQDAVKRSTTSHEVPQGRQFKDTSPCAAWSYSWKVSLCFCVIQYRQKKLVYVTKPLDLKDASDICHFHDFVWTNSINTMLATWFTAALSIDQGFIYDINAI